MIRFINLFYVILHVVKHMSEETKTVSFRLPASLYRQLLEIAHKNMLSVSDVIRQAIKQYVEKVRE